jgi:hypothetical protein
MIPEPDEDNVVPAPPVLLAYPNPFKSSLDLSFELKVASDVSY